MSVHERQGVGDDNIAHVANVKRLRSDAIRDVAVLVRNKSPCEESHGAGDERVSHDDEQAPCHRITSERPTEPRPTLVRKFYPQIHTWSTVSIPGLSTGVGRPQALTDRYGCWWQTTELLAIRELAVSRHCRQRLWP
jgi:hypothetical protein